MGPLISLFWTSSDVYSWFQSQGGFACFFACVRQIPQIHFRCNTCWPLGGQHGSWAILSIYLHTSMEWGMLLFHSIDKTDTTDWTTPTLLKGSLFWMALELSWSHIFHKWPKQIQGNVSRSLVYKFSKKKCLKWLIKNCNVWCYKLTLKLPKQ